MYTLCLTENPIGGFDFTLVQPNTCYVSGQRDTLAEVVEVLERSMKQARDALAVQAVARKVYSASSK